jgi:hypothetical protein
MNEHVHIVVGVITCGYDSERRDFLSLTSQES